MNSNEIVRDDKTGDFLVTFEIDIDTFDTLVRSVVTESTSLRVWESGLVAIKETLKPDGDFDIDLAYHWFGKAVFNQKTIAILKEQIDDKLK